jgi:putative SOS response-associated peptidase YedK
MCNRLCLSTDIATIKRHFAIPGEKTDNRYQTHWNIAPGRTVPVVRHDPLLKQRRVEFMRWGLVSGWAKDMMVVCSNLDLRSRVVAAKEFGQTPGPSRRCLIPADCFYEWRVSDNHPFAVALASRQWMTLAGLWAPWVSPTGANIACFAILTTDPNELLRPLCKRMPVIVPPDKWDLWLARELKDGMAPLFEPLSSDEMTAWPVGKRVKDAKNDDPALLESAAFT